MHPVKIAMAIIAPPGSTVFQHSRSCFISENNEKSLDVDDSLANTPHVPRFFVMRRDGTGYELLRHEDVSEYLKEAEDDVATAVLRTPVEGLPGVTGITVLKPFSGNNTASALYFRVWGD